MWTIVRRAWVVGSLVLLLATAGAWVRAQWVTHQWMQSRTIVPADGGPPWIRTVAVRGEAGSLVVEGNVTQFRPADAEEAKALRASMRVWAVSQWMAAPREADVGGGEGR